MSHLRKNQKYQQAVLFKPIKESVLNEFNYILTQLDIQSQPLLKLAEVQDEKIEYIPSPLFKVLVFYLKIRFDDEIECLSHFIYLIKKTHLYNVEEDHNSMTLELVVLMYDQIRENLVHDPDFNATISHFKAGYNGRIN